MGATGAKVRAKLGSGSKVRAGRGSSHFLANGVAQGGGRTGKCKQRLRGGGTLQSRWEYMDSQTHRPSSFWTSWLAAWGWGKETILPAPIHAPTASRAETCVPNRQEVALTGSQSRGSPSAGHTATVSLHHWRH